MTITCPCCRAANETATCRRCKADLSLLVALETNRAARIVTAQRYAADGRFTEALREVSTAAGLRPGSDVLELRSALQLLAGDFPAAMVAYDKCRNK